MTILPIFVVATVLAVQDAPPQRQTGTRAQTDQTVTVPKGTRIELSDCAGSVVARVWERDQVRVRATHLSRTRVRITQRDQTLLIDAESGLASVDYEITVPAWINLHVDGPACDVDVQGLSGNVSVETVEGDVVLRGLTGSVKAQSLEGQILVEGGRGRVEVHTTDGDIVIQKAAGEVVAESIDGDIQMTDMQATAIEAATVDGDVTFAGTFLASGRYLFTTHDGDIGLIIPENTSATLSVRTFQSQRVDSTLTLKPQSAETRGRRMVYTLGGGSAQVEIESFDGRLHIRKTGETIKRD